MSRFASAVVLVLGVAALAHAQSPRPVRPTVNSTVETLQPRVRLQQDGCFAWTTPIASRQGNTFTIEQSVSPRSPCSTVADVADVVLEQVPAGSYRLVYRATSVGTAPIADYSQEFSVAQATPRGLRVFPASPTALEPVSAQFFLTEGCEVVDAVRPVDGGFAIVLRRTDVDPFLCDAIAYPKLTLGAFAPGSYTLKVVYRAEDGGAEQARTQFAVSPATLATVLTPWTDLSGIWSATDEEPNTALALIHTLDRDAAGLLRDAVVGIWYTYDDAGAPAWYYIEANTDGANFGTRMVGTVSRYRSTNPTAPGFQRTAVGEAVGTIQLKVFDADNPDSISGTLNGRPFDIRIERFRWTRSAWPPPRNAP